MANKPDLQIEQLKSGITTFIFSWVLELSQRTNDPVAATQHVVGWVRDFCDSLENTSAGTEDGSNQNKDNIND